MLSRLAADPDEVGEIEIQAGVARPRRWATIMARHVVLDEIFQCRVASEIAAPIAILTSMEAESFI